MRRRNYYIVFGVIVLVVGSILVGVLVPKNNTNLGNFSGEPLIEGSAATFKIEENVVTEFASYTPEKLEYTPQIPLKEIRSYLGNVDLQGLTISSEVKEQLGTYGFALEQLANWDLLDLYSYDREPYFISTDVCLHLFHLMYDFSLKLIEISDFYSSFNLLLESLRTSQIDLYNIIADSQIQSALERNIAYLSVMLYFFDENMTAIPDIGKSLAVQEIFNIGNETSTFSSIFDILEYFELYQVRGHYNDHELLPSYFKAMMYAGRMGFLLKNMNHTRMTMLLISCFNDTVDSPSFNGTIWDLWERLYNPITFYVGESDDLTAKECFEIWETIGSPAPADFDNNTVSAFMNESKNYRLPKINSMFLANMDDYQNETHSFRLFGQRFVPDNYIFQKLMNPHVGDRGPPKGLDVFSVFGSPRADKHLEDENSIYPGYDYQVDSLRDEFGNLNETYWTQNLYWMWIYSLFPLLKPASAGYPGFMQSDAWSDKALMTVMSSWAELKHDTILYAKYPSASWGIAPEYFGYVEPYPEVYSRLSSLTQYMIDGLTKYNLELMGFNERLILMKEMFDKLKDISISELENEKLSDNDMNYLINIGGKLSNIYDFQLFDMKVTKERSTIIADVATANFQVLEVAVGNPCRLYVVVQDHRGRLKLTFGAAYSYYEFIQPISNILNDVTWQTLLDSNPPVMPEWITQNIPIIVYVPSTAVMIHYQRKRSVSS
ncbi:MAG: DUF3160 domain-containing protein [Asgard group archaeon]|nr:DUF3160 domain-containing protein [Asgard group archaeon]